MPFDTADARALLTDARRHDEAGLRERIQELAIPRLSGSEGAEETDRALRERFEDLGYDVAELPFTFSTWPGRFGLPAAGVVLLLTAIAALAVLLAGLPIAALVVLLVGLGLAVLPLLLLGWSIRSLPWGRIESTNLLFTRPDSVPAWLVMAHRDSKSQLVPTLIRTGAIGLGGLAWLVLLVVASLWLAGGAYQLPGLAVGAAIALAAAGLALGLSWAGNDSPGALDNATGLAAVLAVAESTDERVGFLVTDGEELGLAGARAVVADLPALQGVINVEGLDDRGGLRVAEGHGWRRRGSAPQLAAALLSAGRALEIDVHRRRLPRSILVDHLPLSEAGIPAVTLLRGDWRSLLRVHRKADAADRLAGRGAAAGATVLSGALRLLGESARQHLARDRSRGS